jgi:hypothetical protein
MVVFLGVLGYVGWCAMGDALPRSLRAPGIPVPPFLVRSSCCSNDTAAIATLRNLASCQQEFRKRRIADTDGDRIGEYGTFLEMTGSVGPRRDAQGATLGVALDSPILSPALANADAGGIVTKSGYCFRILLPGEDGGAIHEVGPPPRRGGSSGGCGCCGPRRSTVPPPPPPSPAPAPTQAPLLDGPARADAAEARWCAYAWPVAWGNSGTRAFFVDQDGEVWQTANRVLPYSGGKGGLPAWDAAMPASSGPGWASLPAKAPEFRGRDGNVWKRTN